MIASLALGDRVKELERQLAEALAAKDREEAALRAVVETCAEVADPLDCTCWTAPCNHDAHNRAREIAKRIRSLVPVDALQEEIRKSRFEEAKWWWNRIYWLDAFLITDEKYGKRAEIDRHIESLQQPTKKAGEI